MSFFLKFDAKKGYPTVLIISLIFNQRYLHIKCNQSNIEVLKNESFLLLEIIVMNKLDA